MGAWGALKRVFGPAVVFISGVIPVWALVLMLRESQGWMGLSSQGWGIVAAIVLTVGLVATLWRFQLQLDAFQGQLKSLPNPVHSSPEHPAEVPQADPQTGARAIVSEASPVLLGAADDFEWLRRALPNLPAGQKTVLRDMLHEGGVVAMSEAMSRAHLDGINLAETGVIVRLKKGLTESWFEIAEKARPIVQEYFGG